MADFLSALDGGQEQSKFGFESEVPKTPAEMETRKSEWKAALDKINSDPNLLRAMMVAGFSMMQPGANFGGSALKGMAAYEAGEQAQLQKQAKEFEQQRLLDKDARESALSQSQLQTQELNRQNLSQQMQFREQEQPLALDEKRQRLEQIKAQIRNLDADNRRGDVGLSLQRERLQLEREMKDADRALKERDLTIKEIDLHSRRQALSDTGGGKMTDAERAIQGLMETPELQALPENERRAVATERYSRMTRGMPGQVRQEGQAQTMQQKALDTYYGLKDVDPETRELTFLLSPDQRVLYTRGEQLAGGQSVAPGGQAAPARKPISAAEIREKLGGK